MSDIPDPEISTETINCPNCGGVATYRPGAASTLCPYCGQSIPTPVRPDVRPPRPRVSPASNQPTRAHAPVTGCGPAIAILIGVLVFAGTIIGYNLLAARPRTPPTPFPSLFPSVAPTEAPAPTAVPPTAALWNITLQFGQKGSGPGSFEDPNRVGMDGKGNIYVGEYTGGRVQVFDNEGNYITQWFIDDQKSILYAMAVNPQGVVYLANGGNLERYDGLTGKKLGALPYPKPGFDAVALTPDGGSVAMWNSYFTTQSGASERLVGFDNTGKKTFELNEPITSQTGDNNQLYIQLAVDRQGGIYVLSSRAGAIFKYSADGKFITRFGSPGANPGQLNGVLDGFTIDQRGQVYISDDDGLVVFTGDGGYLKTIPTDGRLRGLVFDAQNQLWAATGFKVVRLTIY